MSTVNNESKIPSHKQTNEEEESRSDKDALVIRNLPERLREERKRRRLTLAEVSAETGLTTSTISRIENGVYKPRAETFMELLRWLGVDFDQVDVPKREAAPIDIMTQISLLLKNDPSLNREAADSLLQAWRPMYKVYKRK